jgi:hypothetical protein
MIFSQTVFLYRRNRKTAENALRRAFQIKREMDGTTSHANRAMRSSHELLDLKGRAGRR